MFKFEQQGNNIEIYFNEKYLCLIKDAEILHEDYIKYGNCYLSSLDNRLIVHANDFEVVPFYFNKIEAKDNYYQVLSGNSFINLKTNNAAITDSKIMYLGVLKQHELECEDSQSTLKSFNFTAQSFSQPNILAFINKPPSFSVTFYLDSGFSKPVFDYKDRQIINISTSVVYAQVICNLPLAQQSFYNSVVKLTTIFSSGFQTSTILSVNASNVNYSGFSASGKIDYSDFYNQNDGLAKILVTISPFVYQNKLKTKSLVFGGASYSPLPNLTSLGISTLKIFATQNLFNVANLANQGLISLGYSIFSANPSFSNSSALLPMANSIPGIHTYSYESLLYSSISSTYNGFAGAIFNFGLGVNSSNYPYIESVFVSSEDLQSSPNLSSYNILCNLFYSNNTVQSVCVPQNNIKVVNDGVQNYIFANIYWLKYVNPTLGVTTIQMQISKQVSHFPSEMRLYECGLYNYASSFNTMSQKTHYLPLSNLPNSEVLDIKAGDCIYGYDLLNKQLIETKVLAVRRGIAEPIYRIYFDDNVLEIPESSIVYSPDGPINVWVVKQGVKLFKYNQYHSVNKVEIVHYLPHSILETDCGNYFIDETLVSFALSEYHKKFFKTRCQA